MPHKKNRESCARCGADLENDDGYRVCKECAERARVWGNSTVYLLIDNTDLFNRGGHFTESEFMPTLRNGYWPEGMVVEKWKRRQYVGTYEVRGLKIVSIDRDPQGDGMFLVPTEDGSISMLKNPFATTKNQHV